MDKSLPADWLTVKPRSIITISDAQGIQDSMRRGLGVKGIDYTVKSVARMNHLDRLSTHLFFTLNDAEQVVYLLVKIVDDLVDPYLYFAVPGLVAGTRRELLDAGMLWLFQQPPNPDNYDPASLRYSLTVRQTVDKDGRQTEVNYNLKEQGELQCDYQETPIPSGMPDALLATIVEYRTGQPVENPEFLILETGARRSARSYVQFFLGCSIRLSEMDVLGV
jgi:hypothetical protein